jgi:pSer/pThr/pTyr-binding forkhead associated (FHA) protein
MPAAAPAVRPSSGPHAPVSGQARDPELVDPNAAQVIAGFLVSYEGSDTGTFWPIYQGQNMVGRKGAAPGLTVEIDHPTTSSRHAMLLASARPARIKLEDLGSTNGTFVSDQALERGRKHELRDGDSVRFGGFTAIIKIV